MLVVIGAGSADATAQLLIGQSRDGDEPGAAGVVLRNVRVGRPHSLGSWVRLTYTSAGERRTADYALSVELCAPGDTRTPSCVEAAG